MTRQSFDVRIVDGAGGASSIGTAGAQNVQLTSPNSSNLVTVRTPADASSNGIFALTTNSYPQKWNGTTWDRDRKANTVGRLPSSAATNNATLLKASAGDVHHINGHNATAGVKYLKLYNKATAPTVGTDAPFLTLALAASTPFKFDFPGGLYFSTGIGYGIVTGAADADNTGVAAADILGLNITYI